MAMEVQLVADKLRLLLEDLHATKSSSDTDPIAYATIAPVAIVAMKEPYGDT